MSSSDSAMVRVNVIVEAVSFDRVADALQVAGLEIIQRLDQLAVITGEVRADDVAGLEAVDGVVTVEVDRDVGPMGDN